MGGICSPSKQLRLFIGIFNVTHPRMVFDYYYSQVVIGVKQEQEFIDLGLFQCQAMTLPLPPCPTWSGGDR